MSLEQKIEELTEAVKSLTQATLFVAQIMNTPRMVVEPSPAANVPPEEPKRVVEGEAAPKPTKGKTEKPKPEPVKVDLTYDQVASAFKKYIAATSHAQAVELLATFDARTLKDVPEAKWPLILKACEQ